MAEENLDPISVPLPATDDTVYLNNAGAIPSSDLHSNASGSEDENDDDVIDDETNNTNVNKNVSGVEEEDEEGEEADEVTDLPTPRGKMVTLTPSFNRSSRSRRIEPSIELSRTRFMVDAQGDHEMSDEVGPGSYVKEDEEMEDDENDTMHAHLEKRKVRPGVGGKVRNHREVGVAQRGHNVDAEEEDTEEDEEEEQEGEEEKEEDDEEEDGSGSEREDFDRTIKIPMHTPSRSAVPKRLLGNTSPGRTPIVRARARSATTTTTPAGRFPSLDFTTPGIAATSFPATVGRHNLRTPFFYHGTPINLSRPSAVQHHQLAVQNELLFDEIKEKEAQIKYLQGLVESAAASPSADPPPLTDAEMEELVSFDDSPVGKRVRLSAGGFATPKAGELSVPKTRGKTRGKSVSVSAAATPVLGSSEKGKMSTIATPQSALKGTPVKTLFENMTMTPSRFSVTADNLFGTPTRIPMPQFEMKTKRQRKEEKRRRMTAQLREFSEINIDMLKGWLPTDGAVPEDAEDDGSLPVGPKSAPVSTITSVIEEGEEGEEDKPQGEELEEEKPQEAQDESAAEKDEDQDMADVALAVEEPAPLPTTISAPAQIPARQLKILPADQVLTTRKRSNSAPAVPHITTTSEEEEDDADISISPLAQEMITALQQRCLALEREIETSNTALQKATAQLVGEMRARKAAVEVREFLETEKKFGVCCDAARKGVEVQAVEKKKKASAAVANSTMPPPAAGKKRTRDEREASTQPEHRAAAVRPMSRAAAVRPPSRNTASRLAEKRVHSGPAAAATAPPPTRPTRATAARAAAAKKPLGKATINEQPARHPPITTAMEKPAVRGGTLPRPTSKSADRNEEPAFGRTTRARSGSTAGDGARPMSRYGDRPVRNVDTGLDVFGRLATGARKR